MSTPDDTAVTPTSTAPPIEVAWGAEPDPSDIPMVGQFSASWRLVSALAAGVVVAAVLLISGAWSWTHAADSASSSTGKTIAPAAAPASSAAAAPPPVASAPLATPTVTVTITETPAPRLTPAPSIPAVAQEICGMLRRYPGMYPVDVALTLSEDRHQYRTYDDARPVVDDAITNYCPEQAR